MSNTKGEQSPSAYTPPKLKPPKLDFSQFQEMAQFFKQYLEQSPLKKWIILAGLGALAEILHILWLVVRYVGSF